MAVWPNGTRVKPLVSSRWKEYEGKPDSTHWGLDTYGYKYNCAIAAGEVIHTGWNTFGGGGREVWYRLENGDVVVYYHNGNELLVATGDLVLEAQPLGVQSDTGRADGIHNHTEIWLEGRRDSRTDPEAYIAALVGSTLAGGSLRVIPTEEDDTTMRIIKNKNDTSIHSSHFLWIAGKAPEVISNSTVSIYKDAGVKVYKTSRARWLWLYERETKRATNK